MEYLSSLGMEVIGHR